MSITFSHMEYHSISVDQARYYTYIVTKYLGTATVKTSTHFYMTTLPSDMIFTKDDVYNIDDQVEKLTRELMTVSIGVLLKLLGNGLWMI